MKPIEKMTDLELREAVALEIMGVHVKKGREKFLCDLVIPGGVNQIGYCLPSRKLLTVRDLIMAVPAYESDMNAAWVMQTRTIEREKGTPEEGSYQAALEQLLRERLVAGRKGQQGNSTSTFESQLRGMLIMADAKDRCRAALKAVRAK